ncbi:MAG TPA: universal stress protein [Solirubrobacterales bacterium]|nr:universal stress protein [Solirubrobacterales bacterium]
MFKTVVVAMDGSRGSADALPVAHELAKREGGSLVLVHVVEKIAAKGGATIRADEDEVRADLERKVEELSAEGVDASLQVVGITLGGPAHAIADIADEAGADLIVAGTRGHTQLGGLLLGSTTNRLLHVAKCPVLAVPPAA